MSTMAVVSSPLSPFLLLCSLLPFTTRAATPDATVEVNGVTFDATFASFGSHQALSGVLSLPSPMDPLLCNENYTQDEFLGSTQDLILLVPRGKCTFERKALNAQTIGARGILIYNTLESRYVWNDTAASVVYPENKTDYDCANGQSVIQDLILDPPAYNASRHDPLLTFSSPDNQCLVDDPSRCESQRCLVTGPPAATAATDNGGAFQGCCAWDIHLRMSGDPTLEESVTDLVAVFLTMQQAQALFNVPKDTTVITIQARPYPKFNLSSLFLWIFATIVVAFGSWSSAKDYRRAKREWMQYIETSVGQQRLGQGAIELTPRGDEQAHYDEAVAMDEETVSTLDLSVEDEEEEGVRYDGEEVSTIASTLDSGNLPVRDAEAFSQSQSRTILPQEEFELHDEEAHPQSTNNPAPSTLPVAEQEPAAHHETNDVPQQQQQQQIIMAVRPSGSQSGTLELSAWHAVAFVIVASTILLVLFYFKIYTFVTVIYGVGCSGAMSHLIFIPGYRFVCRRFGVSRKCCFTSITSSTCFHLNEIQWVDVCAASSAYLVGAMWLYVAFTDEEPSRNTFFWVTQDVMGASLSILFLGLLRLGSIKVATILLVAVFIYDIFFVFISPYLFKGESVMVNVATSGGPPEASEDYCEKYPNDDQCEGGDPLPLVLAIPRLRDYRGGSSVLGLADIVLPGLLIAFAGRVDEAKRLVGCLTGLQMNAPTKWYSGYWFPLVVAYAVGLLIANVAVYLMERGQPALLYLVPACLGTMLFMGRKELGDLWKGPKVLTYADRILKFHPEDVETVLITPTLRQADEILGRANEALPAPVPDEATEDLERVATLPLEDEVRARTNETGPSPVSEEATEDFDTSRIQIAATLQLADEILARANDTRPTLVTEEATNASRTETGSVRSLV